MWIFIITVTGVFKKYAMWLTNYFRMFRARCQETILRQTTTVSFSCDGKMWRRT